MKHDYIIQCKRVILNNKKYNKFIQLTLADKLYLIKLSKKLKKDKNMESITFEEFVLLCKHLKKTTVLRVESKYSTSFIDILQFNTTTLHSVLFKIVNEIELYNEEDKYNNLEDIIYMLQINKVMLFNTFEDLCNKLDVKISIE